MLSPLSSTIKMLKIYQIVEFPEESSKNNRSIYVVPSRWIEWDKKICSLVCKFMPPPYNKQTIGKLQKLISSDCEAPQSWFRYPVAIRGEAQTFNEAQTKMASFVSSEKDYAYSTDNEDHAKSRSAQVTKNFKDKVHTRGKNVDQILYETADESPESELQDSSFEQDEAGKRSCAISKSSRKKGNPKIAQQANSDTNSVSNKLIRSPPTIEPISDLDDKNEVVYAEDDASKRSCAISKTLEKNGNPKIAQQTTSNSVSNKLIRHPPTIEPILDVRENEMVYAKEILLLHKAIKALTVEVSLQSEQFHQLRNAIDRTLKIRVDDMTLQKFMEKHSIILKLENIEDFRAFDTRLSENDEMLTDFKSALKHLVEQDMSKTMTTVLKRILHRELAMKLTAVRQSKDKIVIKDTLVIQTLFELTCHECQGEGKAVTEKLFYKALGSILNNAKDWDGQRNVRRTHAADPIAVDVPLEN